MPTTFKGYLHKSLFFVSILVLVSSCGGKKDLTAEEASKNLIAAYNPDVVFSMAIGDMVEKSGIKGGDVIPWAFRQLFGDYLDYLTNEEKFGMKYDGKTFLMMNISEGNLEKLIYVSNLSDPELFAAQMKTETEKEPLENSGYNYVLNDENNIAISWYKTFAVIIYSGDKNPGKEKMEALNEEVMSKAIEKAEPASDYNKFLAENADFVAFYRFADFLDFNPANMEMYGEQEEMQKSTEYMKRMKEFYGNSYSVYSLNFDIDKITGKVMNSLDDKASRRIFEMSGKGVKDDFMKYIGNENLVGFATISVKPLPVFNFIKEMAGGEFENELAELKEETGFDINEWIGGFSGDLAIAFTGVKEVEHTYTYLDENGKETEESYTSTIPRVNFIVGVEGNLLQTVFDTLSGMEKKEGYFRLEEAYFTFSGNKLFISTDEEEVQYLVKNGSFPEFRLRSGENISSQRMAFGYMDFKKLNEITSQAESAKGLDMDFGSILKNFDYATASGNQDEMVFELHLVPTGKNSLYIITKSYFDMFGDMGFDDLGL